MSSISPRDPIINGMMKVMEEVLRIPALFPLASLKVDLDYLAKFHEVMEAAIVEHHEKMKWQAAVDVISTQQPNPTELDEYLGDEIGMTVEAFSTALRGSLLITCLSLLESSLRSVCKDTCESPEEPPDPRRGALWKYQNRLTEAGLVDSHDASHTWDTISGLADIRNVIVHARGELGNDERSKRIWEFVAAHGELFEPGLASELRLTERLCPFAIRTLETLCDELMEALRAQHQGQQPS